MKTEVIMKREFYSDMISQKSKSGFLSATELVRIGNRIRAMESQQPFSWSNWKAQKSTKEFIDKLEKKLGMKVIFSGRGRGKHTWVHPYLFIDLAMSINMDFKIEAITWLSDNLLNYRSDSGDSYKLMAGALYYETSNKQMFPFFIKEVAIKIKKACGVLDWQESTEKQLQLRNDIHKNIALLTDVIRDVDKAVEIGIDKTLKMEV